MKNKILSGAILALMFLCVYPAMAQTSQPAFTRVDGEYIASRYQWAYGAIKTTNAVPVGAGTIIINAPSVTLNDGSTLFPFSILAPLTIDQGSPISETVLPTAVSGCSSNAPNATCAVTATFVNAHGPSAVVTSGTFGLQEAILDAAGFNGAGLNAANGGIVVVDKSWPGTTTQIAGTAAGAGAGASPQGNAIVMPDVVIADKRNSIVRYWNPTPTGAVQAKITAPTTAAACTLTIQMCSDANVAGSASWATAIYGAFTCVDIMGNESAASLTTVTFVPVASKAIDMPMPAATTGAGCVGVVPYLSLANGTYAQAYQLPVTSALCTLTTLETVTPACANANSTYGQAASTFGASGLFAGGMQFTGYPVTTSPHFPALGSLAMTAASMTPISNNSVTYAYAPGNRVGACGSSSANVINYAAAPSTATTIPNAVATWTIPAGCFNYVGAEFNVSGKFTFTDGGDTTTQIVVYWDAPLSDTTTVPTVLCNMNVVATGAGAAQNATYNCTIKTATAGTTGTALVNGFSDIALASGQTTLVRSALDTAVAPSAATVNWTAPARVVVYLIGTGATNNPGAQGLAATLSVLN